MVKKDQTSSRHIRNLSNEQKNSKLITDKKSISKRNSPSDLWIPRVKIPHLTKRISQFKSLKCMLHFLLKKTAIDYILFLLILKKKDLISR
ncbi:hypothetical protein LEP1GSC131_2947, partial [Leptospira kirschneri str. 200802841]